ncbi:MAG TPA: amidohydrolase [Kofleriaceae bacterium]|jgi:hippurate hydrolase|nr:amidohydrolase [Kofleriaceae bacterium]
MTRSLAALVLGLGMALLAPRAHAQATNPALSGLDELYPKLDALYLDLHKNPELSMREQKTSARLAGELRALGYEVTTGVGGTGVVGILKNGEGPIVLVRTELDALPIEEKTGLPYASTAQAVDVNGRTQPVMHACGHDAHMAGWTGAAALLARHKQAWRGTLMMIGQPGEEVVQGARAMLADGLYKRFGKPSFAIAVHDSSDAPAGKVSVIPGYGMASVDSVDLTIFGRSGHGAKPNTTVDPVVIAARTVLALQTLVSREKDPLEPAVVTVGSIHGGTKHNIIPEEVKLQITVRTYNPAVRKQLLGGIGRIAKAEAAAANAPREPEMKVSESQDATYNDPALAHRLETALEGALGKDNVSEGRPEMVAEDFGEFGKAAGAPSVLLRVGAVEPKKFAAATAGGTPLPSLHSATFTPDREHTIRTATTVLVVSVLEILGKK